MQSNTAPFSTEHWPQEWQNGIIKTSNSMGIMTTELSPVAKQFVEFAKTAQKPLLDIGASYGVATYPALQQGAEVIACDLSEADLAVLKQGVPASHQNKLQTLCARFPYDVHLPQDSLSGIHISMVLHFLHGVDVEAGLKQCHHWLAKSGKLFIVVMTPYHGIFSNVMSVYEERIKAGEQWPGAIDLHQHVPENWRHQLPPFAHFFMPDVLQAAVEKAGFMVEVNEHFCYDNFPVQYKTNGKEFVGLIARK